MLGPISGRLDGQCLFQTPPNALFVPGLPTMPLPRLTMAAAFCGAKSKYTAFCAVSKMPIDLGLTITQGFQQKLLQLQVHTSAQCLGPTLQRIPPVAVALLWHRHTEQQFVWNLKLKLNFKAVPPHIAAAIIARLAAGTLCKFPKHTCAKRNVSCYFLDILTNQP